jgi:flagellar hook-associated protein 2
MTTTAITGFGGETLYMTNFGVETQRDGTIKVNETKFKAAFAANPVGFAAIMDSRAVSSNSQVTTSLSGTNYVPGSYDLAISGGSGTIGGTTLSKSGTTYSAASGDAQGLSLDYSGSDITSSILIGRSMAQTLIDFTTELLRNDGTIEKKITAFNTGIADDDLAMTELDERMDKIRSRYVSRFSAMEAVSNQMRQTGEALTNMMDAWRSSLDN